MKPFIDPAFWSDADIERLDAAGKLTALWLVTNSQTNLLGICSASENRYSFETGLESEGLARAIQALPRAFIRVGNSVFIRNFIRHQFGAGDSLKRNNFFRALMRLLEGVRDEELKAEILTEYPEFTEALPEGFVRACQAQGKVRKGKDKERKGTEEGVQGENGVHEGKNGDSVPTTDQSRRIASIFRRKLTTPWNAKEIKTYKTIGTIVGEDLDALEAYYGAHWPPRRDVNVLRHDLSTFLNNITGEIDRAHAWKAAKCIQGKNSRLPDEDMPPILTA